MSAVSPIFTAPKNAMKLSDLTIEMWPIDRPIDYPKNARKWSKNAIAKVGLSIRQYGFRQPIVVDKNGVIVIGHLRRAAAKAEGYTEVPVHVAANLSDAQIRGLRLMDNRSAQEATFDLEMLGAEFLELKALDFDLKLTGFDTREIDNFTLSVNPAEDDVPPVPESPVSRTGDLWLMGEHRLLCGDCTSSEAVALLLSDRKPFLMVTDPPYGVEYDAGWRDEAAKHCESMGNRKDTAKGKVSNDDRSDWSPAWALFPGDVAYVWHAGIFAGDVAISLMSKGLLIRAQIIWAKSHIAIGRGAYHWQHEPCWYAVRKGSVSHWSGDRTQSTLWQIPKPQKSETGHSTQKPVECMRRPIINHTISGDSVYDPFLGSGTTLIAAELTSRVCYGLELSPQYVDVIVTRWQNLTGKQATLYGSGATFDHVKCDRSLGVRDAIKEEVQGLAK